MDLGSDKGGGDFKLFYGAGVDYQLDDGMAVGTAVLLTGGSFKWQVLTFTIMW